MSGKRTAKKGRPTPKRQPRQTPSLHLPAGEHIKLLDEQYEYEESLLWLAEHGGASALSELESRLRSAFDQVVSLSAPYTDDAERQFDRAELVRLILCRMYVEWLMAAGPCITNVDGREHTREDLLGMYDTPAHVKRIADRRRLDLDREVREAVRRMPLAVPSNWML